MDKKRFFERTKPVKKGRTVCWEWTLCKSWQGYGVLRWKGRTAKAHRVSWVLSKKMEIPPGKVILHKCDNRACVRPSHLSVGTMRENVYDMVAKGRSRGCKPDAYQEGHNRPKLSPSVVLDMRHMATSSGTSYAALGRTFGVSWQTARKAVLGITWKAVE